MIKFSVVIPLYNKEKEIVETINSVLNQSYKANEIIVVNDGSTDRSIDRVKEIFKDKITVINQKNRGVSTTRNRGLEEAKNEYIALIDGDDLWEEDFLKEIVLLIEKFPRAIFYSTSHIFIDEYGNLLETKEEFSYQKEIDNFTATFSKNYTLINASSVCVKKSSKIKFPSDEKRGEDICVWLTLSLKGTLGISSRPLSIYRLNASNRSHTIHKEAIVPCPIKWFYKNKEQLKGHKHYKSIRYFIYSNIFITVYGGFSLSGDRASTKAVIKLMKQNKDRFYLLLYPAYWVPVSFLEKIKKIRRSIR